MISWFRRLSWKWKLLLAFVVFSIFSMGFVLSDWGQDTMRAFIKKQYDQTPEAERRNSPWAKRYLQLAFFCGSIRGDEVQAVDMYKEFLGIKDNPATGKNFFSPGGKGKLYGLCSEDGKTGWGPMQDLAPDAFYSYIELYEPKNSSQFTFDRCVEYYLLLYDFVRKNSDDRKPHPKFKKYWDKLVILAHKYPVHFPSGVKENAPDASPYSGDD